MTIKFNNEEELEYLQAIETEEYYNGASRRTLTFTLPTDISIDTLNTLASVEENLESLSLVNDEITNVYDGYVLKLALGVKSNLEDAQTNTYRDNLELKLGKRTYIEQQLHNFGLM